MSDDAVQDYLQKLAVLRADRSNWDNQWEEAAARVLPVHRDNFTSRGSAMVGGGGEKKTELQFDSTASIAAQRFSSVIESLATPQNSIWHQLQAIDSVLKRNRSVRMFFDDLSEVLFNYRYRPTANFVGNSQQSYLSLGVYGNGILYVDKPEDAKGLRYRNIHLAEAYFAENHAHVVDTLYRVYSPTARQIVQQFGDRAPAEIKEKAKSATQSEVKSEVLHCVHPNSDYDPQRLDAKGRMYSSVYLHVESRTVMEEGGYYTFPYPVSRYTQASGEVYGRGPAQWVLPAIKTLNEQKRDVLKQAHRILDPVLLAHDDGNIGNFSMRAGAVNPGTMTKDGKRLVDVLPTGNIAVGEKMMDIEKGIINDAFLITLFQILVDGPQMTATEVIERTREKGMLLAPTAGRMQSEFLGPLIEREIDVLARQGLLPRPPAILLEAETEYRIVYNSPMSRMQRAEKVAAFDRAISRASEYAKLTGDMSILDWYAFDRAMPEYNDIQGVQTTWTASQDEVDAKRAARAEAAQQQQTIDAAPAMASVAKTAATTLPK